jgi:hypothetical protein
MLARHDALALPKADEKRGPQITLIPLIFYIFVICVKLCNLWTFFIGGVKIDFPRKLGG